MQGGLNTPMPMCTLRSMRASREPKRKRECIAARVTQQVAIRTGVQDLRGIPCVASYWAYFPDL
jgi:hypothetical protein